MKMVLDDNDFKIKTGFTSKEAQEYLDETAIYNDFKIPSIFLNFIGQTMYDDIRKRIKASRDEIDKKFSAMEPDPKKVEELERHFPKEKPVPIEI